MTQDNGMEKWQPPRGPVFKVVVWLILLLIVLGAVAGLVMTIFA